MSQVQALEQQLAEAKTLIRVRQMAQRLIQNPDFKELIIDGYCLREAARYVQESADPALDKDARADALAQAQASGHLKRFISYAIQMGANAERTLGDLEAAIDEARAEGGDE